jgi:hypothetical protein
MNRKSLWIVLSALVMASLILSACAPAATPAPRVPAAQAPAAPTAAQKMVTIRWRTPPLLYSQEGAAHDPGSMITGLK